MRERVPIKAYYGSPGKGLSARKSSQNSREEACERGEASSRWFGIMVHPRSTLLWSFVQTVQQKDAVERETAAVRSTYHTDQTR